MKTLLKILLIPIALIVLLLSILFTDIGNNFIEPYIESKLESEIKLPVKIKQFKLSYDNLKLNIIVDNSLNLDIITLFTLLTPSLDGSYKLSTNNFIYNGATIKEANIDGKFKGLLDNILVNGQGTLSNAPLNYELYVKNGNAHDVKFSIKNILMSDILEISKQPAIAKGRVDANITIPTLSEKEKLHINIKMHLADITFNDNLVHKLYEIELPKELKLYGDIDSKIIGIQADAIVKIKSNIANIDLPNLKANLETQHIISNYIIDIFNLQTLSRTLNTKLNGAVVLKGVIEQSNILKITGDTDSFEGELKYALINNDLSLSLNSIPIQNILKTFTLAQFASSLTSGELKYNLLTKEGDSKLLLENFQFSSNKITKSLDSIFHQDPSLIVFKETSLTAQINEDAILYSLNAKANRSSLSIYNGKMNQKKDNNRADIRFTYDKYNINGTIDGLLRDPNITFNTEKFITDQLINVIFEDKVKKEAERFFGGLFKEF